MPTATGATFSCDGCKRSFAWKEQLAGKKVKCKCGQIMSVPRSMGGAPAAATPATLPRPSIRTAEPAIPKQSPPPARRQETEAEDDALYALAAMEAEAGKNLPVEVIAAPVPVMAAIAPAARKSNIPLAYQRGPSQREKERDPRNTLMDMRRDIHAPIALIIAGAILYISYYAIHYELGGAGIAFTAVGLCIMTVMEAIFLIGFALVVAGPLGVSFGGIGTAILKLAAIAVFCDGVTTWVDAGIGKISGGVGGGGPFGPGAIGLPVATAIYWLLMIYLFSMDPGDSWLVVVILSIFYRILRVVLLVLMLQFILSLGGAASSIPVGGGPPPNASDPTIARVADDKESNSLVDALKWIDDGHQSMMRPDVMQWYDAGAKHVWFETGRDFNGKISGGEVIVELPKAKADRDKCYDILKAYYTAARFGTDPSRFQDQNMQYMPVMTK